MASSRPKVPPVNAELIGIEKYGVVGKDRYGDDELDWSAVWSGSAPAFVTTTAAFRYGDDDFEETVVQVSFPSDLAEVIPRWRLRYVRGGEHLIEIDQIEDRSDAGFLRAIAKTNEGTKA